MIVSEALAADRDKLGVRFFEYVALPCRVIFGFGTIIRVEEEVAKLFMRRPLILTTPEQSAQGTEVLRALGSRAAGIFSKAAMHTPVHITDEAVRTYEELEADGIISIGGGSTIGLGKAIAYRNDAKQIVLPTTYAGSEMTTILGQTEGGEKTTLKSAKVLPETVIYDVQLTMTLPPKLSGASGINAIAHAVEAMYAEGANPVLTLMAERGLAALFGALPVISREPSNKEARADALYGAWLCAICLGSGGVALHHKLCHVLGGSFNLPHAETHAAVLPHALRYNELYIENAMVSLRRATGSDDPANALYQLAKAVQAETALSAFGMPQNGIDDAVRVAMRNPYRNPRPIEADGIRNVIEAAWSGRAP